MSREINKELKFGLNKFSTYEKFSFKVRESKKKLLNIFLKESLTSYTKN